MLLMHDFLLVEELSNNDTIEGTNLKILQDDLSPFMHVKIVDCSAELLQEYLKYYPGIAPSKALFIIKNFYKPGNKILINRIAKKATDNGLYLVSFKDVLAVEEDLSIPVEETDFKEEILIRG